jgi:cardiolipin-specific phospholipase
MIKLSGKDRALNEFSVERSGEKADQNLVILHGYGAGLGFFYKNFEGLSRQKGWKLYALDLLGMGRSSRPHFRIPHKDREKAIAEAENWFIDALEEWRVQKKIDRFTLLGHSLGGYMAVAYALKYPGHLNKLILASPVGIPEDPYAVNADMPEPTDSTMANEFTQDQGETLEGHTEIAKTGDRNNFLNARSRAEKESEDKTADPNRPPPRKPLPKWLTYLWDANISPFSLVRWSGPLGPRLVSGWTSRRFSHLPPAEAHALHDYAYSLFRLRGSGEYALAYILAPGAFARSPLIRRIQGVGRQFITSAQANGANSPRPSTEEPRQQRENGIPVVLMYGENDWMDVAGGFAAKHKMDEEKKNILEAKSKEERGRDEGETKVVIIKKAGHHVYLDGWEEFNEVMREEMSEVDRREERRKERGM